MDVDIMLVNQPCELIDLSNSGELHFVDDEDFDVQSQQLRNFTSQITVSGDFIRLRGNANATRHHSVHASVAKRPERDVTSTLAKLPTELKGQRRLSSGHRAIRECQLRHQSPVILRTTNVTATLSSFRAPAPLIGSVDCDHGLHFPTRRLYPQ